MLCNVVLDAVRVTLNDPNDTVYPSDQKIAALNEGIRALGIYRPDSAAYTTNLSLVAGTRQDLPSDCVRLLRAVRNRSGSAGVTIGKAVRLMDVSRLDDRNQDWHTSTGDAVLEYGYEATNPKVVWVYPGVPSGATNRYLEVFYQRSIPEVTSGSDSFPLDETYSVAVKEWMLYALWGGDDDTSPNYSKALKRQESFFNLLNVRSQTDAVSPSNDKARSAG